MVDKPYRLPDPEKEPAAFLVILYKTLKRIEFDDRAWDKVYFARCMKRSQQLLEALRGDVAAAARCMQDLKNKFEGDGLSWTIETIIQYSFEWRSDHNNVSDRDCLSDLAKAYSGKAINAVLKPPVQLAPPVREPDPVISEEERQEAIEFLEKTKKKLRDEAKRIPLQEASGGDH